MRVLILSQFFDPEPTLKGLAFAKELQKHGCEVEVLTGFPNYPGGRVYEGYRLRLYEREVLDGIPVHRVWLYPSHDASARRRVLNYASFALSASLLGIWRVRRPDVVYVHHPPATIGLPANLLRLFRGAPFVYDIHDLWPDTLEATGMVGGGRVARGVVGFVGRLMERTYRRAAGILAISEGFKRRLVARGVPAEKIEVVQTWCEESAVRPEPRDPALARELGIEAPFVLMFAGNLGLAQGLDAVLDAAALLAEEGAGILLVFVGTGLEEGRLRARAEAEGLGNVRFVGRRPLGEMGRILPLADALLVHLRDDPLFAITIPGKTQTYLYVGLPVLMAVRGDAADVISSAGAGVLAEPENSRSIADAALRLAAMPPAERGAMGAAGRVYYDRELSLSVGAARHAAALARAVAGGGARG